MTKPTDLNEIQQRVQQFLEQHEGNRFRGQMPLYVQRQLFGSDIDRGGYWVLSGSVVEFFQRDEAGDLFTAMHMDLGTGSLYIATDGGGRRDAAARKMRPLFGNVTQVA